MTSRPILFSSTMVRALLDGTKTQTRRVCKPAETAFLSRVIPVSEPNQSEQRPPNMTPGWFGDEEGEVAFKSPFGIVGDQLWVRETWSTHACFDNESPSSLKELRSLHYWADGDKLTGKKRPSIFMPRWASRITLEITSVRVERLQDISEADALSEGCVSSINLQGGRFANENYCHLWETINGDDSWDANPWVWVIEFKKVKP